MRITLMALSAMVAGVALNSEPAEARSRHHRHHGHHHRTNVVIRYKTKVVYLKSPAGTAIEHAVQTAPSIKDSTEQMVVRERQVIRPETIDGHPANPYGTLTGGLDAFRKAGR